LGVGGWGSAPKPQTPNPQSPIPINKYFRYYNYLLNQII
jgi:hypothetical protein